MLWGLTVTLALAACGATADHRDCHRSSRPDSVGTDGELHYPEVCTASTLPAAPLPPDPAAPALAKLRPDTPDPCRQYVREHCSRGETCDDVVRDVNKISSRKRPYAQCVALLKHDQNSVSAR
jgi:hypothetical protein